MTDWPFGDLRPLSYDMIVADPPWLFKLRSKEGEAKAPQSHYPCESIEDIRRFPVRDLARGDCALWLWATNPMLDQGIDTLKAWGFTFATPAIGRRKPRMGNRRSGRGIFSDAPANHS